MAPKTHDIITIETAARIKARREYLRLTQQEMSDLLDMNRNTYVHLENGLNAIKAPDLYRISLALRTSVGYLIGELHPKYIEGTATNLLYALPHWSQEMVFEMIRTLHKQLIASQNGEN